MKTEQQRIDLRAIVALANELNVACEVWADEDGFAITMGTGEVERAAGLPRALAIVRAYASTHCAH